MIKIMAENIPIAKESTDTQGNKVIRLYDKDKGGFGDRPLLDKV